MEASGHFQSLYPSLLLQRPVGGEPQQALEHLLDQALSHQFPAPEVQTGRSSPARIWGRYWRGLPKRLLGSLNPGSSSKTRQKLETSDPLELGQMSETHCVPGSFWKNHAQSPAGRLRAA